MAKFEYLAKDIHTGELVADKVQAQLDDLGDNGWELVSTSPRENGYLQFIFKREKPNVHAVRAA